MRCQREALKINQDHIYAVYAWWPQNYLPTWQNYVHDTYTGVFYIDGRNWWMHSLGQNPLAGIPVRHCGAVKDTA